MKLLLLFTFGVAMACCSCSSEYQERLTIARKLKKELEYTLNNQELFGQTVKEEINSLKKEIMIQAKVSGNEELFIAQLGLKY
jgi:hypothetical protein